SRRSAHEGAVPGLLSQAPAGRPAARHGGPGKDPGHGPEGPSAGQGRAKEVRREVTGFIPTPYAGPLMARCAAQFLPIVAARFLGKHAYRGCGGPFRFPAEPSGAPWLVRADHMPGSLWRSGIIGEGAL